MDELEKKIREIVLLEVMVHCQEEIKKLKEVQS
jgi:hypothetical protein